jgi:hypothetical protein
VDVYSLNTCPFVAIGHVSFDGKIVVPSTGVWSPYCAASTLFGIDKFSRSLKIPFDQVKTLTP